MYAYCYDTHGQQRFNKSQCRVVLTLDVLNKIIADSILFFFFFFFFFFQLFFRENKTWDFMWIVCRQTIHMKCQILFILKKKQKKKKKKKKKKKNQNIVCGTRDSHFQGYM